jgi:hypothetical protein
MKKRKNLFGLLNNPKKTFILFLIDLLVLIKNPIIIFNYTAMQ